MLDAQAGRHTDTAVSIPGVDGGTPLVEGHGLAGVIAEGGHRHGAELAGTHGRGDAGEVQLALQQLAQGGIVQQRCRDVATEAQQAVAEET
ncbi:hypothetical protein D3C76_1485540 [compost metagenome]